ncbi:MAG: hypothetical protein HQ553_05300 [Chloroflexi bacterium]|nr:hypothetical protein [Chloroflexota bacterium]
MNLEKSPELSALMEERGIRDEEVTKVISEAESSGDKMYKPDTPDCLAKLKIDEATYFVEYSVIDADNFKVNKAYSMKTDFAEEL